MCEQRQTWARLSQANNFSFERLLWEHLHGNIWEWQEIRHLSAWRAMNVFQVLQRDEQSIEPCNLQTLTEFMESSSKWFSLPMSSSKQIAALSSQLGWFLSPGIITVVLSFLSMPTTFISVVNNALGAMWLEWQQGFSCHYHSLWWTYLHYPSFYLTKIPKVLVWNKTTDWERSVNNRNPPAVWVGIPVPV